MAEVVEARDFRRVLRERLKQETRLLERAAEEACARAVGELVAAGDARGLVDQGHYRQGWSSRPIPGGAEVGNTAPHAVSIERGRRPNMPGPPLAPIRAWVERKLAPPPGAVEGIARAIRDKIHREGSKPHLILVSHRPRIKALFQDAYRRHLTLRRRRG